MRVRLLHDGMAELLNDPGVVDKVMEEARKVRDHARTIAPVASGAYRDSIEVTESSTKLKRDRKPRFAANIGSDLPYAVAVEAHHGTLVRALDAAGGA